MNKWIKLLGIVLVIVVIFLGLKVGLEKGKLPESNSGDVTNIEVDYSKKIIEIDEFVNPIKADLENDINIRRESINVTESEIGSIANEYMATFETDELPATAIIHKDDMVIIAPITDFLDTQYYYFKEGKLVMYVREFMGVGGNITYYFDGEEIISVKENIEAGIVVVKEEVQDILSMANNNYTKFVSQDV